VDYVLIAVVLTNLTLLGSSRLRACIRAFAIQGAFVSVLPLLAPGHGPTLRVIAFAALVAAIKALVFPWLLERAVRQANVPREVEPFVGFTTSLLVGVALLGASLWLGERLSPAGPGFNPRVAPVAFFTIFVGLFLIISRRKALSQVIGYLALENGIYVFSAAQSHFMPLLEIGVLLDVFAAVFVMGIAMFHIGREFDHLDADRLSSLKE